MGNCLGPRNILQLKSCQNFQASGFLPETSSSSLGWVEAASCNNKAGPHDLYGAKLEIWPIQKPHTIGAWHGKVFPPLPKCLGFRSRWSLGLFLSRRMGDTHFFWWSLKYAYRKCTQLMIRTFSQWKQKDNQKMACTLSLHRLAKYSCELIRGHSSQLHCRISSVNPQEIACICNQPQNRRLSTPNLESETASITSFGDHVASTFLCLSFSLAFRSLRSLRSSSTSSTKKWGDSSR